jgi:hypothetical protein
VALPLTGAPAAAPILRVVYFSATDRTGAFVTDLAAADLVVRENRQEREIVQLERATERLHVSVLVDDAGEGGLRGPVAQLAAVLHGLAAFSISVLNPQPYRLTDYSTDDEVLRAAIARLVQRGRVASDGWMPEAVSWAARDMQKRELTRPVIVSLVTSHQEGTGPVTDGFMDDLRASGASLHVVYLGGVQMGKVMMDGPTHSGGSHAVANDSAAFARAMIAVGRTLARQYRLTYVLPDGTRPRPELQITSTRPNVKITAPTRISTR